ncbi:hypothetical protein [Streptomyces sp. NPDC048606]|uniref:hypothetical protein n=1 Tax=Streptomyces sp. NPDC048606 TaxID=3154726 RepID=UPI00343CD5F7
MGVLLGFLLALAVGGTACVVWAERGGPRWVRVVARITLAVGSVARGAAKSRRRGLGGGGRDSGGDE